MILIALAVLCVASVPLTGGSLRRLAQIKVRGLWLGPVAVFVQTVLVTILPGGSESLHAGIHIGTYVLLAAFLWVNRRLVGVGVIAVGAFLNGLAITVNGGVMPAAATALRAAGLDLGGGFHNSAAVAHPHLLWFGDIIPVPWPMPNVLSVGDCIVFIGLLYLLHRVCRAPKPEPDVARTIEPRARPVRPRRVDEVGQARARAAAQWLASASQRLTPRTAVFPGD